MVPYVYRRPHDYRAYVSQQPLLYAPQASAVPTFRAPLRLIYSSGSVYRQGFTPVPARTFRQPLLDSFGASTSLSFSATGTLSGSSDPTAMVLSFAAITRERSRWYRERWDDTPIRAFNPIYTSWTPTGETLLSFSATGTMLAITSGQAAGSATLTFSATANTNNVSLISGQAVLRFDASAVMPATALIAGSTTLTFTLPDVNVPTLRGSVSLSFSASGYALQRVRRISMRIRQNRIEMTMTDDVVKEGSTCSVDTAFFSSSNAALTPATARYRIKDVTNDRVVKDWTELAPAHRIQIDIAAQDNGVYHDRSRPFQRFEERVVAVQANYDTDAQYSDEIAYRIKNLRGFDS